MKTTEIGLRALAHPFGMLSLALLLVNDHLLKHLWPSLLTGKLSDFAGLFFFPFLLAVVLGWLPGLRNGSARGMGIFCFGFTFAWFFGMKTVPGLNLITSGLLRSLTGWESQIVLDPGDLWALVVLPPAWMLWKDLERRPAPARMRSIQALPVLFIAAFATLATSCVEPMQIENLAVEENVIYAGYWPYSSSLDAGHTWVEMDREDLPESVLASLEQQPTFPLTVCDPEDTSRCYRTNKDEKIEISSDGGATWQIGWQIPEGRRKFIDRYQDQSNPCPVIFDIGPYDLAFADAQPANVLVAAMGTNGILTHTPQDGWKEITFPNYVKVPLKAYSFDGAGNVIYPEVIFFSLLALIAVPLLHHWWDFREKKYSSPPDDEYGPLPKHKWMWIAVVTMAVSLLLGRQIIMLRPIYIIYILGIILNIPAVIAILNTVFPGQEEHLIQWRANMRILVIWLTADGLLWLGILPYTWWAKADIQTYGTATAVALTAVLLLAGLSLFLLDRLARKAVKEPPPTAAKPTDNING